MAASLGGGVTGAWLDMGMDEVGRRCNGCGVAEVEGAFGWKDMAAGRRHTRCSACRRDYQQAWYAANAEAHKARAQSRRRDRRIANRAVVDRAKDVQCADCGNRFETEVMDFDHVRGDKSANVAELGHRCSMPRLLAEIAKCDVVCAVCHRVRTHRRIAEAML